jgi:hypothetical protein
MTTQSNVAQINLSMGQNANPQPNRLIRSRQKGRLNELIWIDAFVNANWDRLNSVPKVKRLTIINNAARAYGGLRVYTSGQVDMSFFRKMNGTMRVAKEIHRIDIPEKVAVTSTPEKAFNGNFMDAETCAHVDSWILNHKDFIAENRFLESYELMISELSGKIKEATRSNYESRLEKWQVAPATERPRYNKARANGIRRNELGHILLLKLMSDLGSNYPEIAEFKELLRISPDSNIDLD